MYAFRDIQVKIGSLEFLYLFFVFIFLQDYQSMIELIERCEQYEIISSKIQNNMMISYLTAFARSRYV
jgi:hypothetical protein